MSALSSDGYICVVILGVALFLLGLTAGFFTCPPGCEAVDVRQEGGSVAGLRGSCVGGILPAPYDTFILVSI